uniref:Uncharacterized protein n=1 Tax=Meloidogyne incognita TaxID=6306 RepID=A0A914MRV6_MELIC
MIEKEIKFGALRKVITDNEFKFWNYWQLLLGIHHVQVFYTRGFSINSIHACKSKPKSINVQAIPSRAYSSCSNTNI